MDVDDDDASGRLESNMKAFGSFFCKGLVAWIAKRRLKEERQLGERYETEPDSDYDDTLRDREVPREEAPSLLEGHRLTALFESCHSEKSAEVT